jgi:hypothetical protein
MTVATDADIYTDKRMDLVRRYTKAIIDDRLSQPLMPDTLLFLLPDDGPAFVEQEITVGAAIVRRGEDVYFRHVRTADLPELEV